MVRFRVVGLSFVVCLLFLVSLVPEGQAMQPSSLAVDSTAEISALESGAWLFKVSANSVLLRDVEWQVDATISLGWNVHPASSAGVVLGSFPPLLSKAMSPLPQIYFRVEASEPPSSGQHMVLAVRYADVADQMHVEHVRFYFLLSEQGPIPISYGDYLDALNVGTAKSPEIEVPGFFSTGGKSEEPTLATSNFALAQSPADPSIAENTGCSMSPSGSPSKHGLPVALIFFAAASLFLAFRCLRPRRVARPVLGVFPAGLLILFLSTPSYAETRTVYGYVSFWDTRENRSDVTGSRFATCDDQDDDCIPGTSDCCFTGLPIVEVELRRGSTTGPVADTDVTLGSGWYELTDTAWEDTLYYLRVTFEHEGVPLEHMCTSDLGSSGWRVTITTGFYISQTYTYKPNTSINAAGDTTSLAGDIGSVWTTVFMTDDAIEEEGEVRLRKEYGSENDFDLITTRMDDDYSNSDASCSLSRIRIKGSHSRTNTPAHETGHILHGRVVGCSGGAPVFPPYVSDLAWSFHGAEGTSIPEAIASFVRLLAYRDPDTALSPRTTWADCSDSSGYDNENDIVSMRNVYLSMWDFIDTSDDDTDAYDDYIDLTVKDLMDALVVWQNDAGSEGENRTADEFYMDVTVDACDRANGNEDCDAGEVCRDDDLCWDGDPHGGNLRDWLYHLAADQGEGETYYWYTLVSNSCVGAADTSYPFTGGYRTD